MNPIIEIKKNKNLSKAEFIRLLDTNHSTLTNVVKGNCLTATYLTIIKKISLAYDDIDDKKLIKKYKNWLQENDIEIKR